MRKLKYGKGEERRTVERESRKAEDRIREKGKIWLDLLEKDEKE